MMDDDEIASPDWLELMVSAAMATGADLVGGPVLPRFDNENKRGLGRHPAFRPAYDTSGPVPMIYGCGNCLITRPVFARLAGPAFDLRFNFLGGGNVDFFTRCRQAGLLFHWVAEAVIVETVPDSRTDPGWLALRRSASARSTTLSSTRRRGRAGREPGCWSSCWPCCRCHLLARAVCS